MKLEKLPEKKVVWDCLELFVHLEGDHDHDVADDSDEGDDAEDDGQHYLAQHILRTVLQRKFGNADKNLNTLL